MKKNHALAFGAYQPPGSDGRLLRLIESSLMEREQRGKKPLDLRELLDAKEYERDHGDREVFDTEGVCVDERVICLGEN